VVERSTHWLTGLLLLAIAGLGTVVVLELAGGVAIAPEVTAAAPATAAAEAPAGPAKFQPPAERQFDEISDRPLFFPSRRPFLPPAAPGSQAAPSDDPAAEIELIGVLLTGRERAALVQAAGQPAAHWVHEQQTVAGWLVEEIAADRVRIRDGDHVEVVKLRADQARTPPKSQDQRKSAGRKDAKAANAEQAQTTPVQ
jgi:hypothetical protein